MVPPSAMSESSTAPKLHCLGGGVAPRDLAADLASLLHIPAQARDPLWEILGPSLADPVPAGMEGQVNEFCRAFDVDGGELARAVRACRFLLRGAASRDVSRADFATDLMALSGPGAIGAILLPRYEMAKSRIRREMMGHTIADHGKLVESIDYRVDTTVSSSRAERLGGRVVTLTFGCRARDGREEITIQLLPEAVEELLRVCQKVMS
ncbi:Hypothetical protein A7982_09641 [Minicystis rosea]|nr:Hypothetical protein A7982_09641 [Minicystis rosea]